jgi:hypothetical protein
MARSLSLHTEELPETLEGKPHCNSERSSSLLKTEKSA